MVDMTRQHRLPINGVELTVYEWGAADAPPLVFCHATGFHGRCWDEVIRHLPDYRSFALDARGHGQSENPATRPTWQQYGADLEALMQTLDLRDAVGIGHSMGGNSLVRAARHFKALLLVDPVIFPEDHYTAETYSIDGHFILNRRRQWDSADEMFNSFKGRGPFATWQEAVLRDYCEHGLTATGELACPPEIEAHIYSSANLAVNRDIYDAIRQTAIPVRVLRCGRTANPADLDLAASPTAPGLAGHFQHGEDIVVAESTHYIPMESPALVARHARQLAEDHAER